MHFLPIMVAINARGLVCQAFGQSGRLHAGGGVNRIRVARRGKEGMSWAVLVSFLRNKVKIGVMALVIYAALC